MSENQNIMQGNVGKIKNKPMTCKVCKSDNVTQTTLSEELVLLKCNHCGNKGRNVRKWVGLYDRK